MLGLDFYGVSRKNKINKYRAVWYPKVMFEELTEDDATKAQNMTYNGTPINGTVIGDASDNWRKVESFSTEAAAIAWLKAKAGMPVVTSAGLSALTVDWRCLLRFTTQAYCTMR